MSNAAYLPEMSTGRRFERKFYLLPGRVELAYAVLRHVCRADRDYPEGRVNSLYFDTQDLNSYSASASGDWERYKVRVRWYGEADEDSQTVPVFLERKSKRGFSVAKQRRLFTVPADHLRPDRLREGILDRHALVDTLAEMGHHADGPLQPIVAVSYRRRRLSEMLTGVRVSLDSEIRSALVARQIASGQPEIRLPGGVVEVKGPTMDLPPTLQRIRLLDTGWSRFSKYCHCLGLHLSETEAVGGPWPSGLLAGTRG